MSKKSSGIYKCISENEIGITEKQIQINLNGKFFKFKKYITL